MTTLETITPEEIAQARTALARLFDPSSESYLPPSLADPQALQDAQIHTATLIRAINPRVGVFITPLLQTAEADRLQQVLVGHPDLDPEALASDPLWKALGENGQRVLTDPRFREPFALHAIRTHLATQPDITDVDAYTAYNEDTTTLLRAAGIIQPEILEPPAQDAHPMTGDDLHRVSDTEKPEYMPTFHGYREAMIHAGPDSLNIEFLKQSQTLQGQKGGPKKWKARALSAAHIAAQQHFEAQKAKEQAELDAAKISTPLALAAELRSVFPPVQYSGTDPQAQQQVINTIHKVHIPRLVKAGRIDQAIVEQPFIAEATQELTKPVLPQLQTEPTCRLAFILGTGGQLLENDRLQRWLSAAPQEWINNLYRQVEEGKGQDLYQEAVQQRDEMFRAIQAYANAIAERTAAATNQAAQILQGNKLPPVVPQLVLTEKMLGSILMGLGWEAGLVVLLLEQAKTRGITTSSQPFGFNENAVIQAIVNGPPQEAPRRPQAQNEGLFNKLKRGAQQVAQATKNELRPGRHWEQAIPEIRRQLEQAKLPVPPAQQIR